MFAYISGKLTYKTPTFIVVDVQGVGYAVHISLQTFAAVQSSEEGKLWIHAHIKEDSFDLYGFHTISERDIFRHLISVSGIGPNTARIVLSSMSSEEVKVALIEEDELAFRRIKGVGPKTAKRIIIDLKDKVMKEGATDLSSGTLSSSQPARSEATAALLALGFNQNEISKALSKITGQLTEEVSTEEMIKQGLRILSKAR